MLEPVGVETAVRFWVRDESRTTLVCLSRPLEILLGGLSEVIRIDKVLAGVVGRFLRLFIRVVSYGVVMPGQAHDSDWRLCRSGRSKWKGAYNSQLLDSWDDLDQAEADLGIRTGQPFLLRPDGTPDADVIAYFTSPAFRRLATSSRTRMQWI